MGRKKIVITPILDPKSRNITYNKRKLALLKKAAELSMLCSSKVFLAFTDTCDNLIIYVNPDVEFLKEEIYHQKKKKIYSFTKNDYPKFFKLVKKREEKKNEDDQKQGETKKRSEKKVKIHEKLLQKTDMLNTISQMGLNDLCERNKVNKKEEALPEEQRPQYHSKMVETEPKSSPSPSKSRKLSIQIPKNKDLEYKMNMIKLMESLTKKNLDKQQLSSLFVQKTNINIHKDNNNNFSNMFKNHQILAKDGNNSKNDLKQISMDSTNSVSKPQLSDLLPSFSCEKKSTKFFADNDKNDEININCKRKFFDFIDETKHKSNSSISYLNEFRVPHFTLSQNDSENFHRGNDILASKKHKSVNRNEFEIHGMIPINSLENSKISKEGYIHELSKIKKLKHSHTQEFDERNDFEKKEGDPFEFFQ